MAMELPPSRYRVIERGRRLEVIDTLAGRRPAYAPAAATFPDPVRPQPWVGTLPADGWQGEAVDPEYEPAAVEEYSRSPPPPAPVGSMPVAPPDFLINAASIVSSERDRDGRLLLNTARWYDAKGPRTVALDQAGERKLGAAILVLLALVVGGIVVGVLVGWLGFAFAFIAVSLGGRIKTIATPWLDRLAAASR
jgi:hypothetical protein